MHDASAEEDLGLMARIADRDPVAFRRLADKYMARSVGFVKRLVGSQAVAEDVVQEAFAALWKQAPRWQPRAKFTTWWHQVLSNLSNRQFRDRLRGYEPIDEEIEDDAPGTEERLLSAERQAAVKAALLALPHRQRLAIVLFYYEELQQREVCEIMKVSTGALESLLSRGKERLRGVLREATRQKGDAHER